MNRVGRLVALAKERFETGDGLIGSAAGVLVIKGLSVLLGFAVTFVLARILGEAGYGDYSGAIAWLTILSVPALLGVDVLTTREIAKARSGDRKHLYGSIVRGGLKRVTLAALGVGAVGNLIVVAIEGSFTVTPLILAIMFIPVYSILQLLQSALRGFGAARLAVLPQSVVVPASVLLVVLGYQIFAEVGSVEAVAAKGIAVSVACIVAVILLYRCEKDTFATDMADGTAQWDGWLKSGLTLMIAGSFGIFVQHIPVGLLRFMGSAVETGTYDVARRGAQVLGFTLFAVRIPLAPVMAYHYKRNALARLEEAYRTGSMGALLLSVPIFVVYVIWGRQLLGLFGERFSNGWLLLLVLSAGHVVDISVGCVETALKMTGHEREAMLGMGAAVLVTVIGTPLLIWQFGLIGAGIGSVLAVLAYNAVCAYYVVKYTGVMPLLFIGGYQTASGFDRNNDTGND